MAKRFLDTNIWNKKWIRELDPKLKLFWLYLMSKCDHAGIYDVDIELASFQLKVELSEKEILKAFNGNIKIIKNNKWFIPKFIDFQYGTLNDKVNAHRSAINILEKYGLYKNKELNNSCLSVKDKDKDKVKVKEENKEEKFGIEVVGKALTIVPSPHPDLVKEFTYYWSEKNRSGKKMRFELEKTWDTKLRLVRWSNNDFNSKNVSKSFKLDQTGNAYICWCSGCGSSDFYDKQGIRNDSICCKKELLPEHPKKGMLN